MPETVEASIAELQSRGYQFSDEELQIISEDWHAMRENAAMVGSNFGFFDKDYKNVIVEDPDAPLMYSRRVIYFFSVFCGALVGSIMIAMNIAKTGKKTEALYTVLFGTAFTTIQIFIGLRMISGSSTSYSIAFGLVAAYCLDYFFWKRFIGYSIFYRARPFWTPLIIVAIIAILIVIATKYGGQ
ncbi:MAG: hypothetical protein ACHQF4_06590 [Sphingobacteriales bacterium]